MAASSKKMTTEEKPITRANAQTAAKPSGKSSGRSTGRTSAQNTGRSSGQTAARSTSKTAGRPRKQAEPVVEPDSFIRAEVMILVSFAFAVLLFLSNFHLCGVAGDFLRALQLGVFGMVGFIAPLLLFVGTCFYMSNRGNRTAMRKMAASIALVLALCGFSQIFFGKDPEAGKGVLEYYHLSAEGGFGGGLIGGMICMGLKSVLGTIGAFLILLVVSLISIVCITEKSIVNAVKRSSDAAYQHAKEDIDRRRELYAERQEERRRLREEQRVRGVNLQSTYLEPNEEDEYSNEEEPMEEELPGGALYGSEGPEAAWPEIPVTSGRAERNVKAVPSKADIFTGNITMPQEYHDEDAVPFDVDEPEISAQDLVAEGIRSFEKEEELFLGHKVSEWDALHIGSTDADAEAPLDPADLDRIPRITPHGTESTARSKVASISDYMPKVERMPEPDVSDDVTLYMEEPTSYDPEPVVDPESVMRTGAADRSAAGTAEQWKEEPKMRTGDGSFRIPEKEKRVVTAGGKIIETDTEALQKKLESRRKEAQESGEVGVQQQIQKKEEAPKKEYVFPPVSLLKRGSRIAGSHSEKEYRETAIKLQQTLRNFGVGVTVTNISCGPSVTRYELHPEQGVKVSKIVGLTDDIKLSLAAEEIRIEAPIPGKSAVGIEVPNKENNTVYLRELLEAENFQNHASKLAFAVGKDIGGQVVVTDIAKMPHLLIAGATGSGKSVCINTLIMSIIFKSSPDDVKLIMVDPKVVELSVYNGIPHLLIPVVTDPKKASGALNWAVAEMTDRYKKFAEYNVRDLKGYNAKVESIKDIEDDKKPTKLPQIVIIVDELADLMMVAPGEVEDAICRLAQLARAAGIHLVIATQRPSVNVITGLIKANIPSRIAFAVSSGVDSRTIIDMNGAEKLLGKGDMLFYPAGFPKPQRVQGAFVSDQEVQKVVDFLTEQGMTADYNPEVEQQMSAAPAAAAAGGSGNGRDEYFAQAGKFIIEKEKASIGMLQRVFKIGFNRAARIMDQLADAGVVGEEEGTKPRKVLMTMDEFDELLSRG